MTEEEAAVPPQDMSDENSHATRIAVRFPEHVELFWASAASIVSSWQAGDVVSFRNGRWRVVERVADANLVTLTLGVVE